MVEGDIFTDSYTTNGGYYVELGFLSHRCRTTWTMHREKDHASLTNSVTLASRSL